MLTALDGLLQVARAHFNDGEGSGQVADQSPTLRVVRKGGASPAQEGFESPTLAVLALKLAVLEIVDGGVEDLRITQSHESGHGRLDLVGKSVELRY